MNDVDSIVISSRIRIARNVSGMFFPSRMKISDGLALIPKVADAVSGIGKFKIYSFSKLSDKDAEVMFEKHLISREAMNNKECGAAIIRDDELVSIMVNEEDHIRAQCIMKGFVLDEAYSTINDIDDIIADKLNYAFSKEYGFLTSCVTNLGTGLRSSVMMFLPALTLSNKIENIVSAVKSKGLTVRGELGEGSAPLGYLYQVSNAISLGISEKETISAVATAVRRIADLEKEERNRIVKNLDIKDLCVRAFGILSNCALLTWEEFMVYSGQVKLGFALNYLGVKDPMVFDKISATITDAGIMKMANKQLTRKEISKYRANYVSNVLKNVRIK